MKDKFDIGQEVYFFIPVELHRLGYHSELKRSIHKGKIIKKSITKSVTDKGEFTSKCYLIKNMMSDNIFDKDYCTIDEKFISLSKEKFKENIISYIKGVMLKQTNFNIKIFNKCLSKFDNKEGDLNEYKRNSYLS